MSTYGQKSVLTLKLKLTICKNLSKLNLSVCACLMFFQVGNADLGRWKSDDAPADPDARWNMCTKSVVWMT